jgi:hypothetical protein
MSSMVGEASAVMLWFMGKPYRDRRNTFLIGALVSRNRTSFSLEIFMCEQCARRFSAREGGRAVLQPGFETSGWAYSGSQL